MAPKTSSTLPVPDGLQTPSAFKTDKAKHKQADDIPSSETANVKRKRDNIETTQVEPVAKPPAREQLAPAGPSNPRPAPPVAPPAAKRQKKDTDIFIPKKAGLSLPYRAHDKTNVYFQRRAPNQLQGQPNSRRKHD